MPGYIIHKDETGKQKYSKYKEYTETPYEAPEDKKTYLYGQNMALPVPTLPAKVDTYTLTGFTFDAGMIIRNIRAENIHLSGRRKRATSNTMRAG